MTGGQTDRRNGRHPRQQRARQPKRLEEHRSRNHTALQQNNDEATALYFASILVKCVRITGRVTC